MGAISLLGRVAAGALIALALLASSALAVTGEFEAEGHPVTLTGSKLGEKGHVFTVEGGTKSIACETATFSVELVDPSKTLQVSPTYGGCTGFGFSATVKMEGCAFVVDADEETAAFEFKGTADVVCPEGKKIKMNAGTCEVQIGAQTNRSKVEYDDNEEASPPDFQLTVDLKELSYTKVDGFLCPLFGSGAGSDGTYAGDSLVEATRPWEGEVEQVGAGVGKKANTTLCKAKPVKGVCGETYGKGTSLEAVANFAAQEPTKLYILEDAAAIRDEIECLKSKIVAKTKAAEGDPLPIEGFLATFDECDSLNGACQVKMAGPESGSIAALGFKGFDDGEIETAATITVVCLKGEIKTVNCTYSSDDLWMKIIGETVAAIQVGRILPAEVMEGEVNCFDKLQWGITKYSVAKPGPLWVSY